MGERNVLQAFGKYLFQTPVALVLLILEFVGVWAVLRWVVDDPSEAIVSASFIMVILLSQYLLYRKLWRETQALPNIGFDQIRMAQIHSQSPFLGKSIPRYVPVQAWFANAPGNPTESSIARHATARITIIKSDGLRLIQYYGQWADSNAPDNVGFNDILDFVDIPPSHLRAKLLVALKYPADSEAYGFTREGFRSSGDGRSSRFQIPPGTYRVEVELSGVGVNEIFSFQLRNNGAGTDLELEPDIDKKRAP